MPEWSEVETGALAPLDVDPWGIEPPDEGVLYVPPVKLRARDKGAAIRRRFPIRGYIGANGMGKTLACVHDAGVSLDNGRRVLSTVRLIDPATGEDHPLYERLTEWSQLLDASSCDVIFDEVIGIANSRSSAGMPVQVQTLLNQLRRRDMTLSWTAPSWSRADVIIREVSQSVTMCRGYFPKIQRVPGADHDRQWGANRLFRFITYDAADFATWSDAKEGKLNGKDNSWYWRGKTARAQYLYDTLDGVDRIGETLDSGRCAYCGGTRTAPKCSCGDSHSGSRSAFRSSGRTDDFSPEPSGEHLELIARPASVAPGRGYGAGS